MKALRKGAAVNAICIIAGDISPIDVITHVPILCEDHDVPYVFVPSKHYLGEAATTKSPTSCVMIIPGDGWKYADKFSKLRKRLLLSELSCVNVVCSYDIIIITIIN